MFLAVIILVTKVRVRKEIKIGHYQLKNVLI